MASLSNNLTQEKVILLIIGLFVASMIGVYTFTQWRQQQVNSSSLPSSAPLSITLGDSDDESKVVIYTDPACDKCAAYHEDVVTPLYEERVKKGELSIEIRPVGIVSEYSAPLNELIMCSNEQDAYLTTMSYITTNLIGEDSYSEAKAATFFDDHSVKNIAQNTEMNHHELAACLKDTRYDNKMTQADSKAYSANVYSTPTTFVGDSEPVRGYSSPAYINRLIDIHLSV